MALKRKQSEETISAHPPKKSKINLENGIINLLLGISPEEFFSSYWQKKPFTCTKKDVLKKFCIDLDVYTISRDHRFVLKEDIHISQYIKTEDNVLVQPQRQILDSEDIALFLSQKNSLKLVKPYVFSKEIEEIFLNFKELFDPINEPRIELNFIPIASSPFSPCVDWHDSFIIQVQGEQQIFLYENPLKDPDPKTALTFSLEDLQSHSLQSIVLEPGDCLYIPKNCVFWQETNQKTSLDLSIGIPPQPDCEDLVDIVVSSVKQSIGRKDKNYIPKCYGGRDFLDEEIITQAQSLFKDAVHSCSIISENIKKQRKFSKIDFEASQFVDKYDIVEELEKEENGGIIKISNFLPIEIADKIYQVLTEIREDQWVDTSSEQDYVNNNISHKFVSSKNFNHSESIFSIFRRLIPELECTLSAARYTAGHFIDPHDDNAQKIINEVTYWRKVAIVYYLTPNWTTEAGGVFMDRQGKKEFVPEYNSLVAFVVPRDHEVTLVKGDNQRYSIFGWFLEEEEGSEDESEDDGPLRVGGRLLFEKDEEEEEEEKK